MTTMKSQLMKYLTLVVWLASCLGFAGCQKAPMNGKVDGHWQLMSFETTDGTIHPCKRIYFSIQLQLIEINNKGDDRYGNFIGRFHYNPETEKIAVSEFRQRGEEERVATPDQLLPFGMNSTETVFTVIEANGKTLILKSDYATLTFRIF